MLAKSQSRDENIESEYQHHLEEASRRYHLKKEDKEAAIKSDGRMKLLTVELQKCLPTIFLTNEQSFYKLKLWTYNYTISDFAGSAATCNMWDESISGRGANEMASGLFLHKNGVYGDIL
nr:unnamed protein product [Callosobruchus analis]